MPDEPLDIKPVVDFIQEQGDAIEQARLAHLLHNTPPDTAILNLFSAAQREDGGWAPFWASDYSSIDATCYHLSQASQLGVATHEPVVQQALHFLDHRQQADGSWQEEQSVTDRAPLWVKPGNQAATIYLTANAGYWMTRHQSSTAGCQRAAQWLHQHYQQGELPSFLHANWLAAGIWWAMGNQAAANATMTYLATQLPAMQADNLAWLITTFGDVGVAPNEPLLQQAVIRLLPLRDHTGRWQSDDGEPFDVHVNLEALRALQICAIL